jgi:DNA-binding NarL/FixJ family response regulator
MFPSGSFQALHGFQPRIAVFRNCIFLCDIAADEAQAALDVGFACYIAKPFNYEDLTQAIRTVMAEK